MLNLLGVLGAIVDILREVMMICAISFRYRS